MAKMDRERTSFPAELEFGRLERRLVEQRARIVREAERLLRNADPAHVELVIAVDVLKELRRVGAGRNVVEANERLRRDRSHDLVGDGLPVVPGVGRALVDRHAQITTQW